MGTGSENGFDPSDGLLAGKMDDELPVEEASSSELELSSDPSDSDRQEGDEIMMGDGKDPNDALAAGDPRSVGNFGECGLSGIKRTRSWVWDS